MSPVKKDNFARAATQKGFLECRKGHHIYYRYRTPEGKLCPFIHTRVSHGGGKDISKSLLSEMASQMNFDKTADLTAFVECTFSKEKYLDLLRTKGLVT